MKYLVCATVVIVGLMANPTPNSTFFKGGFENKAEAAVRWVNAPSTSRGGYWRDTSNDGNPHNNANYLGLND